MSLVILCDMFLNPSFKITTGFANVGRTTHKHKWMHILGKISNHQEWVFTWKITFNFEWIKK